MIKPRLENRLELTNWLFLTCLVISSLLFMTWPFTLGLLLGGLISSLNFLFLKRDLKTFFLEENARGKIRVIFKFYVRFTLTAIALYYIISRQLADIFGLLLGLSVVMIGLTMGVLLERRELFGDGARAKQGKLGSAGEGNGN